MDTIFPHPVWPPPGNINIHCTSQCRNGGGATTEFDRAIIFHPDVYVTLMNMQMLIYFSPITSYLSCVCWKSAFSSASRLPPVFVVPPLESVTFFFCAIHSFRPSRPARSIKSNYWENNGAVCARNIHISMGFSRIPRKHVGTAWPGLLAQHAVWWS